MHELIYAPSDVRDIVEKRFPNAVFEDASDEIHPDRFTVELTEDSEKAQDDFYIFAMKEGFLSYCFCFQLLLHHPNPSKEHIDRMNRILAEGKRNKSNET